MSKHNKRNNGRKRDLNDSKKNESLYLLIEGETELNYFNVLHKGNSIEIEFELKSKLSLELPKVKDIISEILDKGYDSDEIYFVYDTENNQRYINLFEQMKILRKKVNLIISSSCFEVWLLLHFKQLNHNQFTNADERMSELKLVHSSYIKALPEQEIKDIYLPKTSIAIRNAKIVMGAGLNQSNNHTHTNVHLLVERITQS